MTLQYYKNANIYTPIDSGKACSGIEQGNLSIFHNGAMLVEDGVILEIGVPSKIEKRIPEEVVRAAINFQGKCMIPGFVDPHTHCCFAGLREKEFQLRLEGTPYLEILKHGGGILSSVEAVSKISLIGLIKNTLECVTRALHHGTTTIEIKSGYGLSTEMELKMLEAIQIVASQTPVDVIPTYLGAHAIPAEYKGHSDDFISLLINESLPAVKEQGIARFCDVFCEKGVFSIDQSRKLLTRAQEMGFGVKIHADEVHDLGGAGLAAELGAISADHLLAASDKNIKAMEKRGVIANLLPATAYSLRKKYARAKEMIAANVPVALATDCNPGSSYTESMQFVFGLAVLNMNMSPAEALTGVTLNGAYSLGVADKVGSLEVGKDADFLILDGNSPSILAYHAGVSSVHSVYKNGVKVSH
jgi:imidazolonepropionase